MAVRTRRWTRSPRGSFLGVATGLAEWRALPADATRLIVFLLTVCSVFGVFIYLALAVLLPAQTRADIIDNEDWEDNYNDFNYNRRRRTSRRHGAEDASFREASASASRKSDEDLEKEYEELKKKVEKMESDIFDKEKAWDAKFNSETKN